MIGVTSVHHQHSDTRLKGSAASRKAGSEGASGLRKAVSEVGCASIGGRDSSLYLFRALGKILHCKSECLGNVRVHLSVVDLSVGNVKYI